MNTSQTPDPRKDLCDELAMRLRAEDGLRVARLLQAAGFLGDDPRAEPAVPAVRQNEPGPQPISIWTPRQVDGELCFERPAPMALGDHYAATRVLRARKAPGTSRVAFFGESVAAGYLYAPHLTPARLLEDSLNTSRTGQRFEVIDLARTNESLRPLARAIEASLQLDPDLLVLFVGNNWNLLETPEASPQVPSVQARQGAALALRQAGLRGLVARARRLLDRRARQELQNIATLTQGRRVLVILPEVNLADWENRQPVPWLPEEATGLWYVLHDEASGALDRRDPETALVAAQKMLDLDRGLCPTSHRLLGRALLALGRPDEARRAFLAEVDANSSASLAFLGAPQATTQVRQLLLEAAREYGWTLVDLRQVFAQAGHTIPGRELFLDYCHLSRTGMHLAMSAVAERILDRDQDRDRDATTPMSPDPLTPEQEALAHLGAALHTAHRLAGPSAQELIEHGCRRALQLSPGIASTLRDVVAARCSRLPAILHAAQQNNLNSPYQLLLQHGWRWDHLDADVLLAIRTTLAETDQPIDELLERFLLEQLKPGESAKIDCSRAPYLWKPLERLYSEVMDVAEGQHRAFYRALWPRSIFCLIANAEKDVDVRLTARLPTLDNAPARRSQRVQILVNGQERTSIKLSSTWQRRKFRLRADDLERGLNRLTLHWPAPQPAGEIALKQATERLEAGREADLHPIFGEVFSLRVRAVS